MDKLDQVMKTFFYMTCDISKWIIAVKMASNILKKTEDADIKGIIQELITGGVAFGSLYAIVTVLDKVSAVFIEMEG